MGLLNEMLIFLFYFEARINFGYLSYLKRARIYVQ